ncbi:DUF2510 domain-containing protein [Mumia sp. zg.B53]|uniref:DUF2510 domain-containing protein n=1 Tax=Mumia sp. zg.B53 TaxID=2855449 RepID=UPI001C6EEE0D|nr:DUF2510 domain-containing protein [Mumia sp. zg.B53]MBW9214773.1 DUF2510 domain-containing protein [Mumia sp. zg.B53]
MSEQAPAGWYPDGHGSERYWDGATWTSHVRPLGGVTAPSATPQRKDGAISKLGSKLKKAAEDKQAARDELDRKHAEDERAAGPLITSGLFGTSTIEVYASGYVRIATVLSAASRPGKIAKGTPYEKLRSIKFAQPGQDRSPGMTPSLDGMVGPAVSGLLKGGAGIMKASAPGLAVAGLAHLANAQGRKSFLTIVTDKQIHSLTNESNKGHHDVGRALEAAGNSVLSANGTEPLRVTDAQRAEQTQLRMIDQAPGPKTITERIRELAELHKEGLLSDDEFAGAKAKLLGQL